MHVSISFASSGVTSPRIHLESISFSSPLFARSSLHQILEASILFNDHPVSRLPLETPPWRPPAPSGGLKATAPEFTPGSGSGSGGVPGGRIRRQRSVAALDAVIDHAERRHSRNKPGYQQHHFPHHQFFPCCCRICDRAFRSKSLCRCCAGASPDKPVS